MKIQTGLDGTNGNNNGFLRVDINGVNFVPSTSFFEPNQVVIDICFERLDSITVRNEDDDAWTGTINVKVDGVDKKLDCDECGGRLFEHEIVVDGNGDSGDQAPTNCLNGASCTLKISGKIFLNNYYSINI